MDQTEYDKNNHQITNVLKAFEDHKSSNPYLVFWSTHREGNRWFFISDNTINCSIAAHDPTCQMLLDEGKLETDIDDKEFKAQFAVGTKRFKLYLLSEETDDGN